MAGDYTEKCNVNVNGNSIDIAQVVRDLATDFGAKYEVSNDESRYDFSFEKMECTFVAEYDPQNNMVDLSVNGSDKGLVQGYLRLFEVQFEVAQQTHPEKVENRPRKVNALGR
ncbi:MAG: hypothetical protein KKH52_01695 [Nanoarchaeota archaeon]|nr:hypothetical protein [Nanoarchaeota archaeon]MBU1622721.1 hypothetical protein [Nanoarchaeota archaeon]MBU1974085.1 hypothetical protein [Nanoarchaeota archaeon]